MKGASLFDAIAALRREGFTRLPNENLLRLAQHVTHGLSYLHASSFSFGDLKTLNVLLSTPPDLQAGTFPQATQAKLCDFGLSRNLKHLVATDDTRTRPNETQIPARHGPAGTFAYLAPEAFRGLPTDDPDAPKRADIYALGVVLWELATLRRPWPGVRPLQLIGLVARERRRPDWPEDVSYLPKGYVDLVERCWSHDPLDRPTAEEVSRELQTLYCVLPCADEHARSRCSFGRKLPREYISEATQETFSEETITDETVSEDEGSISDDWDIVQVDEEEEFSEEQLRSKGWEWPEDTEQTVTSTVTGDSQRCSTHSRGSMLSDEHVPELEIKKVISYMLPPGWELQQISEEGEQDKYKDTEEVEEDEEERKLLDMAEACEQPPLQKKLSRRDSRRAAYRRRLEETERPGRYSVPLSLKDDEMERELAELATMSNEWEMGLLSMSTAGKCLAPATVSEARVHVKDIVRTYSLPEGLGDSNGDMDQMLRILEAEEVPDINSLGVSMYTRPHFR